MGRVERRISHAVVLYTAPDAALPAWFARSGWVEPAKPGGLHVTIWSRTIGERAEVQVFLDDAPALVTAALVGLARDLAKTHGGRVACHEVVGRDREVRNPHDPTGDPGFELTARSFEIDAAGAVAPLELLVDDDALFHTRGDLDETVRSVLHDLFEMTGGGWARGWSGYLERATGALSPRLADLARVIAEAGPGACTLEPQGARWMLTIVAPVSGKRISVLTDDELRQLRDVAAL